VLGSGRAAGHLLRRRIRASGVHRVCTCERGVHVSAGVLLLLLLLPVMCSFCLWGATTSHTTRL
jgi:hypothetical protein